MGKRRGKLMDGEGSEAVIGEEEHLIKEEQGMRGADGDWIGEVRSWGADWLII